MYILIQKLLSTTQPQRHTGKLSITPSEFSEKIVTNQIFEEELSILITPGEKFKQVCKV